MKEKDNVVFYPVDTLRPTPGIAGRCDAGYIARKLAERFPGDGFTVTRAEVNRSGVYRGRANAIEKALPFLAKLEGLPPYCDVRLTVRTGKEKETVVVWVPLAWNGRFLGTCGGGTSTGGIGYFGKPDNTSRGTTVPFAIMNGFAAATADAGNVTGFDDRMIDPQTHTLRQDYYENWRRRTTHDMARFGKAVTEILHDSPIVFAYLNGGSGGGRQCLVEVQEHPEDFDGVWASCPAINWCRFVPESYFMTEVLRKYGNRLNPAKIRHFAEAARRSVGGDEAYYNMTERIVFDAHNCVGERTKGGVITAADADAMNGLWDGPRRKNGERLWYSFRPGGTFWNVGLPVGAFYYTALRKKARPFYLSTVYLRWGKHDPKAKRKALETESFETLFDDSVKRFGDSAADKTDLSAFASHGKLLIDHGTDDPLIPVEGTLDYYRKVVAAMGKDAVDVFLKLFIMPGDSHGNCRGNGGGMTASTGLKTLIDWVERGVEPKTVPVVRVDWKGNTLSTGERSVYGPEGAER